MYLEIEMVVMAGETTVSERIVREIARAKGVDPLDLEPLYDVIDTDALDSMFQSSPSTASLEFEYSGYEVRVEGPEEIEIAETRAHSFTTA